MIRLQWDRAQKAETEIARLLSENEMLQRRIQELEHFIDNPVAGDTIEITRRSGRSLSGETPK